MNQGKDLCFIIGSADGLAQKMRDDADFILSLSNMTIAHPLALVLLTEQIYRVVSIINRHPYHRG